MKLEYTLGNPPRDTEQSPFPEDEDYANIQRINPFGIEINLHHALNVSLQYVPRECTILDYKRCKDYKGKLPYCPRCPYRKKEVRK